MKRRAAAERRVRVRSEDVKRLVLEPRLDEIERLTEEGAAVLRHVRRLLYATDDLCRERAAEAIAVVAVVLDRTAPAKLGELVASLLWTLNDESGMSGRGTPEAIGRIVERIPGRAKDLVPMLVAYLEREEIALNDEILDGGLLAALGRLGPDVVSLGEAGVERVRSLLASSHPRLRGTAAWATGRLRIEALREDLASARADDRAFPLYRDGEIEAPTVASVVVAALDDLLAEAG